MLSSALSRTWMILAFCCLAGWGPAAEPAGGTERLLALELGPIREEPWRFEKFPILAWWAPPGTAEQRAFDLYRDAGFTLYPLNRDTGHREALAKARAAGLDVVAFRQMQGFGLPSAEVDFEEIAPEVVGWIASDEPHGPDHVVDSISTVHELMAEDPTRWAFFNLLPPFGQPAPGTEAIIDVAVRNGLPILSYDHYIMFADGTTQDQVHYDFLELFRRKSLEHEVPFWAFALTIKHLHYRRPSESDVRFKQFTNLAYGAKGLWYFTYWGPTDWEGWDSRAIVDPRDGSPTDLYHVVKGINGAVLEAGETLLKLTSEGVVHTSPPQGGGKFKEGESWIAEIGATDALVGFFVDEAGAEYAWVVNKRHGAGLSAAETADAVGLRFAAEVEGVTALSWLDGKTGPLTLAEDGRTTLTLAGGTGVLLKARRGGTGGG